ncbi:EAL domain-containing protein [Williamsia phyllosphaerae]|nr:EAL domain-containing protein [Williamsia phyllosphaerae]
MSRGGGTGVESVGKANISMSVSARHPLQGIIGARTRVRSVFQPIVELDSGRVMGHEALARFPDVPDLGPLEVFARARDVGAVAELDWECRRSAYLGAGAAGLAAPLYLFVNVEPSVLGTPPPWRVDPDEVAAIVTAIPTVVELTERSLFTDPRSVIAATDWARSQSCLVALDDVGANPDSVAMLSIVRPDVIKLDRSMLADQHSDEQLRTLRAVWDHVALTGARILCEGVESERDLDRARGCGASLVQGYHLGRPAEATAVDRSGTASDEWMRLGIAPEQVPTPRTDPTSLLRGDRVRVSPVSEIARIGAALDATRSGRRIGGVVLLSLHDPEFYTSWLARRYGELAATNSLVGIIGVGEDLPPGVRGSQVQPMRDHFAYVSLDSDFAMAVVARDLGDTGPVAGRRHEWVLTWDHTEVIEVARNLLGRLTPLPHDGIPAQVAPDDERSDLADIVAMTVRIVPGVESAGLALRTSGGLRTLAASDQYPFLLDLLQHRYAEGPSMEGAQHDPIVHIEAFESDGRWMSFRAAASYAAPIASVLSFRLFTGPNGTGYLTLYSPDNHAFDAASVEAAHALAGYTAEVWTRLRGASGDDRGDVVADLGRTDLSDPLDAAAAAVGRRDDLSPHAALRSIVETSASTGSSLQQTAQQMARRTSTSPTTIPGSDFSSTGPS